MKGFLSFLTLFSSFSTLFCCAIPALFVVFGFGASFAALTEAVPQVILFGQHKELVFALGAFFLGASVYLQYRFKAPETCDIDGACEETRNWSQPLLICSILLYVLGAFFAYGAPFFL